MSANIAYQADFHSESSKVVLTSRLDVTGTNHDTPRLITTCITYSREEIDDRMAAMFKMRETVTEKEFANIILPYNLCLKCFIDNGVLGRFAL